MLESLSQREKKLINLLLICVFIAIIYWGFGEILLPKYKVVKGEFEARKSELEITKALIERLPLLEAENKKLTEEADILREPLNKEVRSGINYYYIGKHAMANNVVITQVQPKPINSNQAVLKIPFDVMVKGNYQDILNFLNLVEHDMPNTTELLSLKLEPYVEGKTVTGNETSGNTGDTSKKQAMKEKQEEKATVMNPMKEPIIAGNNPEVTGVLRIVTYMVKTPKNFRLAQGITILGRFDAFTPTVDVSQATGEAMETVVPVLEGDPDLEGYADKNSPVPDDIFKDAGKDFSENAADDNQGDGTRPSLGASNLSVEQVIIEETGDYSFPLRK
ncbi:MAG: hypothetical protein ACOX47_06170 [Bacillota bacterium]